MPTTDTSQTTRIAKLAAKILRIAHSQNPAMQIQGGGTPSSVLTSMKLYTGTCCPDVIRDIDVSTIATLIGPNTYELNANVTIAANQRLTIAAGSTLRIPSGVTLIIDGHIDVYGRLEINGSVENRSNNTVVNEGEIYLIKNDIANDSICYVINYGTFTNNGTLFIEGGCLFDNMSDGTFNNNGDVTNKGTMTNSGTFTNSGPNSNSLKEYGATIQNIGDMTNTGTITNNGFILNGAELNKSGFYKSTFTNKGTLYNSYCITNFSSFKNYGTITINAGIITNLYELNNMKDAVLTINSGGYIMNIINFKNDDPIKREYECTVTNDGTINNNGFLFNGDFNTDNANVTRDYLRGILINNATINNNAGAKMVNGGTVGSRNYTIANKGTINNVASITNINGATIDNEGNISNNGTLINCGTIEGITRIIGNNVQLCTSPPPIVSVDLSTVATETAPNTYILNADTTIDTNQKLSVPLGTTLSVPATITLTIDGTLEVFGVMKVSGNVNNRSNNTVINKGEFLMIHESNTASNTFTNSGTFTNDGRLDIATSCLFDNKPLGTFINNGYANNGGDINNEGAFTNSGSSFLNKSGATITNTDKGTITNAIGCTFTNYGTMTNATNEAKISNNGTMVNWGDMTNDSTIENYGTMTNSATITNNVRLTNNGTMTNNDGAYIINDGTLVNSAGGTIRTAEGSYITSNGDIESAGAIDNAGYINIYTTKTFNNTGTLDNTGNVYNAGTINNTGTLNNNVVNTNE